MAKCTLPHAFGFYAWFEAKFGDLCFDHDQAYAAKCNRRAADCVLAGRIFARGYVVLALLTYFFVRTVGYLHYPRR